MFSCFFLYKVLNIEANLGSSLFIGLFRSFNSNKIAKYGSNWMWINGEYLNVNRLEPKKN